MTLSRDILFWILSLAVALVSWRFLFWGVDMTMPAMAYHLEARALALYLHIGLAPVALAVLPFQFSTRLRKTRPGLHRWLGRIYGAAVLLAGLAGLSLALNADAGPVAGAGFGLLAVLWLGATAQAVRLAILRRVAEHRRWMIRSAALTLAAVTLRIYLPLLEMTVGFEIGYLLVAWLSWVPNLVLAEAILMRQAAARCN